jgi:hypothetical protein
MFVTETAPELTACPVVVLADAKATVGAPAPAVYPADVPSSVPAAVALPFAVISRQ